MAAPRPRWLPLGEHALHPLLIALILLIFVVKPLVELAVLPAGAMGLTLLLVILAGVTLLEGFGWRMRAAMLATMVAAIGLQGLAIGLPRLLVEVAADASAMLSLLLLAAAILRQTFAPGRITLRRLEGALAAYLLIGLAFAAAYAMVNLLAPGAFERGGVPMLGAPQDAGLLFFSFVTLSTTGYGDIVPVHPVARSLAVLEVITGTLFTTVLIARLVSLELAGRGRS
ncbi:MAG: potassium channel family protein [Acetobacteraceae bacterium]|nr:potassium channel family protein [Acetobacteraceae bacterium]